MIDNTKSTEVEKLKQGKREKKEIMIECKKFVFRPSGNGTVNFAYRLVADEATIMETEKQMEKMKEECEAQTKEHANKTETLTKAQDEFNAFKMIMPVVDEVKAIMPAETELMTPVKPEIKTIEPQAPIKSVSTSKRRKLEILPPIQEETETELSGALSEKGKERWFYEDFCEGKLPPPEEDDDWSEVKPPVINQPESSPSPIKRSNLNVKELERLGFMRKVDSNGVMRVYVTPEAQERAMNSPEYQWYLKMRSENKLKTGNSEDKVVTCTVSSEEFKKIKLQEREKEKEVVVVDQEIQLRKREPQEPVFQGSKRARRS